MTCVVPDCPGCRYCRGESALIPRQAELYARLLGLRGWYSFGLDPAYGGSPTIFWNSTDERSSMDGLDVHNPYEQEADGMVAVGRHEPLVHPAASGLTGATLDELARRRWTEGHQRGYEEGAAAARAEYKHIYDRGVRAGAAAQHGRIGGALGDLVHGVHGRLAEMTVPTDELKATVVAELNRLLSLSVDELAQVIAQFNGELADVSPPRHRVEFTVRGNVGAARRAFNETAAAVDREE